MNKHITNIIEGLKIINTYPDCYIIAEPTMIYVGPKITTEDEDKLIALGWYFSGGQGCYSYEIPYKQG